MSETIAALSGLQSLAQVLSQTHRLPSPSECERYADEMGQLEALTAPPSSADLAALRSELLECCQAGQQPPPRLLRRAPLVLWDQQPFAADFPGLLDALLEGAARRPPWLRSLIEAWLRDFDLGKPRLPEAGLRMADLLGRTRHPRLLRWRQAHERFSMFDGGTGPKRVAAALVAGPASLTTVLEQTGMDDALRGDGRFFRATLAALLAAVPAALVNQYGAEAWTRVAATLEIQRTERDRRGVVVARPELRVPELRGEMIGACLQPWVDGSATISAPRKEVKAFLLRTVGDPRLRADRWSAAPEACTRLMRGWLASETLETFFALISETNDDPQWRYRRDFWRACLRKLPEDRPGEAWVVLGANLAQRANVVSNLAGGYGRLTDTGWISDQAVLLLRFGTIVLCEWSNVGPVRAWRVGDPICPSLYKRDYIAADVRAKSLDFPSNPNSGPGGSRDGKGLYHHSPSRGLWQGRASAFLEQKIGLHLAYSDYMPR